MRNIVLLTAALLGWGGLAIPAQADPAIGVRMNGGNWAVDLSTPGAYWGAAPPPVHIVAPTPVPPPVHIVAPQPAPPPVDMVAPPPPVRWVWMPGYWSWHGHHRYWVEGRWEPRPHGHWHHAPPVPRGYAWGYR